MARLPTGAREYLKHLSRTKEALEHGELAPAQKNLAEQLLGQVALTRQRRQYIADMVAAHWTDQEIKLAFASPDSPMTLLISAFTETDTTKDFQAEINEARKAYTAGGEEARLRALVRERHHLLEITLAALAEAGAAHQKPLLDLADAISRSIAEAEGLQHPRAGRVRTVRTPKGADPAGKPPASEPEAVDDAGWKEFVPDETDD